LKYSRRSKKKYRIVVDANVIVSSVFGGYPARMIGIATSHILFAPVRLEEELRGFLKKLKEKQDFADLENYFEYILHYINLISIENPEQISRDRADDFYMAVAVQEKVDFLITGDKDILSCKDMRDWSFKILTPKEFVEMIESERVSHGE